jgi:hypothetical protein
VGLLAACSSGAEDENEVRSLPELTFTESFDAGPVGADVSTDNSMFNVIENSPATFETTPTPADGEFVGHYQADGDYIRTKNEFTDEGVNEMYERVYLWVDSYPSAVMRFLTFETSPDAEPPGEDVLALRLDRRGYLGAYNGKRFTTVNVTDEPVPVGEWLRLEIGYDADEGPHGQTTVRMYTGDNVNGLLSDESLIVRHVATPTNPVTTAALGVLNAVTVDFSLDAIAGSSERWVGPVQP